MWEEIEAAYTSYGRHYHNFHHLETMLDLVKKWESSLEDPDLIRLSIFYHDLVYKIGKKDNELKSAQVAEKRLTEMKVNRPKVLACFDQILATASHNDPSDRDTAFLIDFDLYILATPAAQYREYVGCIRREYSKYPDLFYKPGRRKVLKHFLKMESIRK